MQDNAATFTDRQPLMLLERDAIIQVLDRESNGIYLSKEAFAPTLDDWNKAHLIFAQDHPDPKAFDADPAKELARIKGRMVEGSAKNTYIEQVGHPTLRTKFELQDKEINDGIDKGEISTSNCFWCKDDGKKLVGPVTPHHILFFREEGKAIPGDKGVLILNQENEGIKLIDQLKAWIARRGPVIEKVPEEESENEMADEELKGKLAAAERELAESKLAFTQLEAKGKEMENALSARNAELKAFKAKEADGKWNAFKAKCVPPGMVAGDKEKEARAEFESDPLAFMEKVLELRSKGMGEENGAEPKEFISVAGKKVKFEDELAKMGIPSVTFEGGNE